MIEYFEEDEEHPIMALKIFNNLTSNDTISISRLGDTVEVYDFWNAISIAFPTNISEISAINSLNSNSNIGDVSISIFDINGKIIHTEQFFNQATPLYKSMDISKFTNGLYFIKITNKDYAATGKFIK